MDMKGYTLISREFVHTTRWPGKMPGKDGPIDVEKQYKEALAGQVCPIMDIAVDGSSYLVIGSDKDGGQFIWDIDIRDTETFLPIKWKYGTLMPTNLSPVEEFKWMMDNMVAESVAAMAKGSKKKKTKKEKTDV
jgi:hypothetical protein